MRFGRFEVQERAGTGASSVVYRALDPASGAVVAVKQMTGGVPAEVLARLRAEARVLTELDDRHVVRLVEAGLADDPPWLAQSWVDGVTLERLLQVHGRLTGEQACGVLLGAARGLGHAHSRGVLHRDVSPGNVLLDGSGTSMLVDFGLASPVGSSGAVGTPAFVSPEGAAGAPVDPRSDVYSAGAVLFLLLSGRPPFPGSEAEQVLQAHRTVPPPAVDGPADRLADLVARCLSKDPKVRPADGAALAAELEEQAERRFGAGWLARASVAGLVPAAVRGAGGSVAAGAASAARETAVLTTGAVDTGGAPVVPAAASIAEAPLPAAAEEPPPVRPRATRKALATVAAAAAVVIVSTVVAVAATGGDDEQATALPTSSAQPVPSAAGDNVERGGLEPQAATAEGTYSGVLRVVSNSGGGEPFETQSEVTVTCDPGCSLDGLSLGDHSPVPLGGQGDSFTIALPAGDSSLCGSDAAAAPQAVTGTVQVTGDTLALEATAEDQVEDCEFGSSTVFGATYTFTGTRDADLQPGTA